MLTCAVVLFPSALRSDSFFLLSHPAPVRYRVGGGQKNLHVGERRVMAWRPDTDAPILTPILMVWGLDTDGLGT